MCNSGGCDGLIGTRDVSYLIVGVNDGDEANNAARRDENLLHRIKIVKWETWKLDID